MQADRLHQEAALLSNELHTFRDDDVAGVKPIIEKILDLRKGWKAIRLRVEHFQKFGRFPEAQPKKISPEVSGSEAELRVELQRINVNIVKYTKKLADNPDHKKASAWEEELARMKAHKMDLQAQITRIKYETTQ
ncbi:hypothetical protein DR864_27330 [Runella rosea]|uniref:Uncharacterized protein n=1 Tax=Runella rosea TaxID=2259595 RepID=A0A344TRB5_9BACT|nr:hypothetical protein [Runella rosea]AXE21186.1 hypothetical protein DR864_27330 [Runella rosea]